MTRINVGIPPKQLKNRHLIAEHREIKRIPNLIASGRAKIINIPEKFTLGTGHVKFFYNKGKYTLNRYREIYNECKNRNFNVTNYESAWDIYNLKPELFNDYSPTEQDIQIITERINSKLK